MRNEPSIDGLRDYMLSLPDVSVETDQAEAMDVYLVNDLPFAYVLNGGALPRISLFADPKLADLLRASYEEVSAGYKLHPKRSITIVLSGQLSQQEIVDLISHSYQRVVAGQAAG